MNFRSIVVAIALGWVTPAFSQQTVIKLGTLAPAGSPWHQVLQRMGQQWRNGSGGQVLLNIFPGGNLGDEPDMVNKMRIGQIQAVALSGAGMSQIEPGVACLQIPMMFQSYEELDYVRDRIAPRLEKMIESRGFVVLNWGDAGWVHFFMRRPATRLSELRQLKLFSWAGDDDTVQLWKANGFQPVALAATDILPGLQTGLIDTVPTTPLYALLDQVFGIARYMSDLKWAPLIGATLVSKSTWDALPPERRAQMLAAARDASDDLRGGIRKMNDAAVEAMQKHKLSVLHADGPTVREWLTEVEKVYPKLRGKVIPADLFDEVQKLRDEFRTRAGGGQ